MDDSKAAVIDSEGKLSTYFFFLNPLVSQGTNILQNFSCPAGRVTYNFHLSCKHMYLYFKSVCNNEHKGVVPYITVKTIFTQSNL